MSKKAFVYILASKRNGILYTGVTSNLFKRMYEHKTKVHPQSFTAKYAVDRLVWYVAGDNITVAIELEKKIKNRNRAWKIALIEKHNPDWKDLSVDFMDSAIPLRYTQNDEDDCHSATSLCHSARSRRIQPEGSNGFRNYVRNDGEIR